MKNLEIQCAGFLLLDDSDFIVLPLRRDGCASCKDWDVYCVDCTLKLYEVLNSEKYKEFYEKPEQERHEIFVSLENDWVEKYQSTQQNVDLAAIGIDPSESNLLQMPLFAEVHPQDNE